MTARELYTRFGGYAKVEELLAKGEYVIVGFRPPVMGEYWLSKESGALWKADRSTHYPGPTKARLIVKPYEPR